MTERDRLIDHCDDEFVRSLLVEGRRPVESSRRTQAVLAAVGVGGAVFSRTSWAAAATWKQAAVALLVVGGGAATYEWATSNTAGRVDGKRIAAVAADLTPKLEASTLARGVAPGAQSSAQPSSTDPVEGPGAVQLPAADAQSSASKSIPRKARDGNVAAQRASLLAEEIALIDEARAELRAGRARKALSVLDRYSAQHANGALQREAELVRIPALYQLGRRTEASARANRVLAKNPSKLVTDQLRVYVNP